MHESEKESEVVQSEKESEVVQSGPTLSDLMDCSLPGSSVHGIFPGKSTGVGCHFIYSGVHMLIPNS